MRTLRRFLLPIILVAVLVASIIVSVRPAPVRVDAAEITRGTLLVTVDEDGRTRVKDRYIVFSPLAGNMDRITLKAGDPITAGRTTVASIDPGDPALLDARAAAEAEARLKAAQAALDRASPQLEAALAASEFAESDFDRVAAAASSDGATEREVEDARLLVTIRRNEAKAAEFARQIAAFEVEQARAALLSTRADHRSADESGRFRIPAPITGRVLRILRDSAGVVATGTPLIEVGDTAQLEIEVDVLSADAVRVRPGHLVLIERWGGDAPLRGHVRVVEPSGYTKISALGVEEQRVDVIIDFADPPEERPGLADGYRVDARIIIAEESDAVLAPSGALFRHDGGWAVFLIEADRAKLRPVTVGRRNDRHAAIVDGLAPGDLVVEYPSDRVRDGVRLRRR